MSTSRGIPTRSADQADAARQPGPWRRTMLLLGTLAAVALVTVGIVLWRPLFGAPPSVPPAVGSNPSAGSCCSAAPDRATSRS